MSPSHNGESLSAIPPVAQPLGPYLRSRQDALRIRQALTLYLQSHIVQDADDTVNPASGHLPLTVPLGESVTVKRIPSHVAGARKEYLLALQAHIAARREYNALSDKITSQSLSKSGRAPGTSTETNSSLSDYLALLRERRQYEKLQLFDLHLKELVSLPEEQHQSKPTVDAQIDELLSSNAYESADQSDDNIQALISKLEKTVTRAKAKLMKEQNLLKQLQNRQATNNATVSDTHGNRLIALHRTRDELVQWVEEKLAITATSDQDVWNHERPYSNDDDDDDTKRAETSRVIAERKAQIREQYAAYVESRKSLLDAVSLLSQPAKSAAPDSHKLVKTQLQISTPNDPTDDWSPADAFRSVSEHILPAVKYQKSLALQRSYLAGMLTKEKTNIKHILDRLSQESHLLPEYPILARQAKFKHITALTGTGLRHPTREGAAPKPPDDVVQRAQAWAFAADAARSTENEYVDQRIEHAAEMADAALDVLQQVYDLLHQERNPSLNMSLKEKEKTKKKNEEEEEEEEEEEGDGDDDDDDDDAQKGDIWTADVHSRKPRVQRRNNQTQQTQQTRGPWSALQGRVGE